MSTNIITAIFPSSMGSQLTYANPVYQYDYGMVLQFVGLSLPVAYEVHFANTDSTGNSITQIGDADGVSVPDELLLTGKTVYAWVYLHSDVDDGETVYKVVIPVNRRAKPTNATPTPVQQDVITEAIAALDAAVEQTAADVQTTSGLVGDARDYASAADRSAQAAAGSAGLALTYAQSASRSAQTASEKASEILNLTGDATVDANTGTPSVEVTVSEVDDHKNMSFSFHNLKGERGETGSQGIPGPTGPEGPAGPEGSPGQPGQDGISPTITVTEITGGHNVEITDAQGTTDFDVMDGEVSEERLETALIDKADIITSSASGEIVTISDGGNDLPVVDLKVSLLPVQNLNGQDAPYPAGGGLNLRAGIDLANDVKDRFASAVIDTTGKTVSFAYDASETGGKYIPSITFKQDTRYTFILSVNNPSAARVNLQIAYTDGTFSYFPDLSGTNVKQTVVAVSTSGKTVLGLVRRKQGGTTYIYYDECCVLEGSHTASDFAPYENICPIIGLTGVAIHQAQINLLDPNDPDFGLYTIGPVGQYVASTPDRITTGYIPCKQGDLVTFDTDEKLGTGTYKIPFGGFAWYDANKTFLSRSYTDNANSFSATAPSGAKFFRMFEQISKLASVSSPSVYQTYGQRVYIGSGVTNNLPYSKNYPIDWTSTAGTVYGGSLDVTSGVLTVDRAIYDMGDLNYTYAGSYRTGMFVTTKTGISQYSEIMSTCYKFGGFSNSSSDFANFKNASIYKWAGASAATRFYVIDERFDDASAIKTALSGEKIVYELATPLIFQLSENQIATFLGVNNFWSNGNGSIDLEYRCDTKLYIEQITKPSEDDMTANQNITASSFFMVGNRLFLSTVAIAQGATIIPGTNCTEISLADALNSLNS